MTASLAVALPFLHSHSSPSFRAYPAHSTITFSPLGSSQLSSINLSCKSGHWRTLWGPYSVISSLNSQPELTELREESDFHSLLSPSGLISICGFGYLLSEKSARSTFRDLKNFRVARLNGFRRVFAHVAPIFFERGIAKPETKEISSLSVEPYEGETLVVTVFEIDKSEIHAFMERELGFRFLAVVPETLDDQPFDRPAVLCALYSDEEFFQVIDAKEARKFIFSIMEDMTCTRSGEMISYLVVLISGTVCWHPRILAAQLMIIFWITISSEIVKQPSVSI